MSKKIFFQRSKSILKKLSAQKYASFEVIETFIRYELEFMDMLEEDWTYSKRTFQRDIQEIKEVWGIEILYHNKERGYYIDDHNPNAQHNLKLFETYEMMTVLKLAENLNQYIIFEPRKPSNTHYFEDVIQAIKKETYLKIDYLKFGATEVSAVKIVPYGLKEHKNRWYIIAKLNNKIKTYALDRIQELTRTTEKFMNQTPLDIGQLYEHNFGIFTNENEDPVRVILRVKAGFAPYIKTLPLHHSQNIVQETESFIDFEYHIKITEDFLSEIHSYGIQAEVISPTNLRAKIKDDLIKQLASYQ